MKTVIEKAVNTELPPAIEHFAEMAGKREEAWAELKRAARDLFSTSGTEQEREERFVQAARRYVHLYEYIGDIIGEISTPIDRPAATSSADAKG